MRVLRFLRPEKFVFAEGYVIFLFSTIFQADLGGILTQTGWVARGVLLLLLLFSIISWAMILQKLGMFGRIRRQSDQFLRLFRATRRSQRLWIGGFTLRLGVCGGLSRTAEPGGRRLE